MEIHYFDCECESGEHVVRFIYDPEDGDVIVEVQLTQYRNVFKRLWIALKYVFGYECKFGHWDSAMISWKQLGRLEEFSKLAQNNHAATNK